MAGKAGRSGRKPLLQEMKVEEILDVSADILIRWLSNSEVSDEKKIPVVTQLIAKRIPAKLEHSGSIDMGLAGKMQKARDRARCCKQKREKQKK